MPNDIHNWIQSRHPNNSIALHFFLSFFIFLFHSIRNSMYLASRCAFILYFNLYYSCHSCYLVELVSYYINPEVTDYYVGLRFSCARWPPQKMSPTQYARTVRCTDEVMCFCVWYGTVRYGTVRYCTVLYHTVRDCTFTVRYGTVPSGMLVSRLQKRTVTGKSQ